MTVQKWKDILFLLQFVGLLFTALVILGNHLLGRRIDKEKALEPFYKEIKRVDATVDLFVESPEKVNARYLGSGAILAFVLGKDAVLIASAPDTVGHQTDNETVHYRGILTLDISHPGFNMPVLELQRAEFAQIEFACMPKQCKVKKGSVFCLLNMSIQLEFEIPEQDIQDGTIFVHNIKYAFKAFPPPATTRPLSTLQYPSSGPSSAPRSFP